MGLDRKIFGRAATWCAAMALGIAGLAPAAHAADTELTSAFDAALGTQVRAPKPYQAIFDSPLNEAIARIADGSGGRIGVYAVDLATGRQVSVLGDQRFP